MKSDSLLARLRPRTAAAIVAVVTTLLCLLTMSRSFGFIDSGEMAAAAATFGIPHPTGYPLLMILGHAAVVLLPVRDVLALNILAALMVGAGAGILTLFFNRMLKGIRPWEEEEPSRAGRTLPFAALAALLTAMTPVWWETGTGFEAYALHALLLPLVLLTFVRYIDSEDRAGDRGEKFHISREALFFSFVVGLSFSNHLSTIILAPALLGWFFYRFGFRKGAWLRLLSFLPGFILGLLPYLYLPIRSATDPALNWGMPTTFDRFLDHVGGAQFRQYMFDFSVVDKQLGWYFSSLPGEFAWLGLLLAIVGLVVLLRHCRPMAALSLVLFLSGLLYAGTYAIKEIEPYFMVATLVVGFWGAVGMLELGRRFGSTLGLSIGAICVVLSGVLNWSLVDRSDDRLAEDVVRNILEPLPQGAILFTTRWDILQSGAFYLQNAEGVRPDITIVNVNMLPDRVYLSQMLDRNPVFKKVSQRIRVFVNERKLYDLHPETRGARNAAYATAFYRMINGIIATSGRPVFVTPEVDQKVGYGWNRIPYYLTLRVTADSAYLPQQPATYRFTLPPYRADADVMSASLFHANALLARSRYEAMYNDTAKAMQYAGQALAFDPQVEVDDVPVLPMGNRKYVEDGARFFESMK